MYLACPTCHLGVFRRPDEPIAERCPHCGARASMSQHRERVRRSAELASEDFACDVVRQGTTSTLRVSGAVDMSEQRRLQAAGIRAAQGCERLVVDMTQTTFISSSGVLALMGIAQATQDGGAQMITLVRRDGPVAKVIELCALSEHLGIVDEPQVAVDANAI